nr:homoserine dehydrogenase [Mucilaginibacter sp. E4BP6]
MKGMDNIMKLRIILRASAHTVYKLPDFVFKEISYLIIDSAAWRYCLSYRINLISV